MRSSGGGLPTQPKALTQRVILAAMASNGPGSPDMQRYFNLFEDRKLSLDIFTVVEDGRLDFRVKHEYPGIKSAYSRVQMDSSEGRPDITTMPAREALVEFLVRLSLQQYREIPAPHDYVDQARQIAAVARQILTADATVEDTAEATLRIYAIISSIPNEEVPPDEWDDVDVEDDQEEEYTDPDEMQQLLQQMAMGMDMELRPEGEQDYESSEEVDYRGDFKPELVQLLTQLRMQQQDGGAEETGEPITQEQLEELLQNSAELDLQAVEGDLQDTQGMFADNLLKEAGMQLPDNPEFSNGRSSTSTKMETRWRRTNRRHLFTTSGTSGPPTTSRGGA